MPEGRRLFAEALAPYGESAVEAAGPHTKLSISLPTPLLELVRASAAANGLSVSATIAAAVRRSLAAAEQDNLDRALEADAEENLAWAAAYAPSAARLLDDLDW